MDSTEGDKVKHWRWGGPSLSLWFPLMKIVKLVDLRVDKEFEGGEVGVVRGGVCISGYQFERTACYGLRACIGC